MQKRMLIISFHFPPRPAVGGLRAYGLARYLPSFGWEPVVLTSDLPSLPPKLECPVVQVPFRDPLGKVKKMLGIDGSQNLTCQVSQLKQSLHVPFLDYGVKAYGEVMAYPDPYRSWYRDALAVAQGIPCDAIVSTSYPPTVHMIASQVDRPWAADFRDLWTRNHYYPYSPVRRAIEERLEKRVLSSALALTTASEELSQELGQLHGRKVSTILNGFDPETVNSGNCPVSPHLSIVYTGTIYEGRQSPEMLFQALRQIGVTGNGLTVDFYGPVYPWLDAMAERYGLKGMVRQHGYVSHEEALVRQREAQVLLLLLWNDSRFGGIYTAKLFEYLAARRPVLAIGPFYDSASKLIRTVGAGTSCFSVEWCCQELERIFRSHRDSGRVEYHGNGIGQYSWVNMARKFAAVLDSL